MWLADGRWCLFSIGKSDNTAGSNTISRIHCIARHKRFFILLVVLIIHTGAGTSAVSTRHTTAGSSSANNSAAAKKGGVTYGATAKDTMQQMQRHLGKK